MTPTQCKMARAALDMSRADLAQLVELGPTTVTRFEQQDGATTGRGTVELIRIALERTGRIEFVGDDTVRYISD